jgi:maleylacetoacetate isomerase
MQLYGFYRSLAAYRVRIALALKGINYDTDSINLFKGEQMEAAFKAVNPQMVVPALVDGDTVVTQSMAILEYLNETAPEPDLLPSDPVGRARVRQICQIFIADAHPLIVPRVRSYLMKELGHSETEMIAWVQNWLGLANEAVESVLLNSTKTGKFCHGDTVTLADLCLVPQIQGSMLFKCEMSGVPTLMKIFEECMQLDAFQKAHPKNQPDFQAE